LLPLGGPKGSGLGFMFEMLASVLASAPIQARALGPERHKSLSQNLAILAVDVAAFRPLVDFTNDAVALAAVIKALPPQPGVDEVRLPGERAARTEAARRKSGIPIPGKLWDELRALAEANEVSLPARLF
jgi:ureidoglycolate dehydrogenase (NAD+)